MQCSHSSVDSGRQWQQSCARPSRNICASLTIWLICVCLSCVNFPALNRAPYRGNLEKRRTCGIQSAPNPAALRRPCRLFQMVVSVLSSAAGGVCSFTNLSSYGAVSNNGPQAVNEVSAPTAVLGTNDAQQLRMLGRPVLRSFARQNAGFATAWRDRKALDAFDNRGERDTLGWTLGNASRVF